MDPRDITEERIVAIGESLVGKTPNELGFQEWKKRVSPKGKGLIGSFIEQGIYGIPANTDEGPDFRTAKIELKVTPIIKKGEKKKALFPLRAKERLQLHTMDFFEDYKFTLFTSPLWKKCEKIYCIFYEYIKGIDEGEFPIRFARLLSFDSEDLQIISADYDRVSSTIKKGECHHLNETDYDYLTPSPTGGKKEKNLTSQPFADIKAPRRRWAYKSSFMTFKEEQWFGASSVGHITRNPEDIKNKGIIALIKSKTDKYIGKSIREIANSLCIAIKPNKKYIQRNGGGIDSEDFSKATATLVFRAMLGLKKGQLSELEAANIHLRTQWVFPNNQSQEPFPLGGVFHYKDIIQTPFEDSEIYEWLHKIYIIANWKLSPEIKKPQLIFAGFKTLRIPEEDIETFCRDTYETTVSHIKQGIIIDDPEKNKTALPLTGFNGVMFVKPHAANGFKMDPLPVPDVKTGQTEFGLRGFWLTSKYVKERSK